MMVDQKLLALGFIMISLAGCGGAGKDMPKLGTVTGTVTLDGQPLKGAKVQFVPNDSRPSGAITDDQGKYQLIFNENTNGAAVGKHTFVFRSVPPWSERSYPEIQYQDGIVCRRKGRQK